MTYKETFFFVAKCLTVSHDSKNKSEVEIILKNSTIDWDSVVKLSTSHMVLVSLFFNLRNANLLNYLPTDLVKYMKYIARLNKNRNNNIISQLNEINDLLLKNEITPIFLKGTSNIIELLYTDISERMISDIDFLVSEDDYERSIDLLKKNNYVQQDLKQSYYSGFRHYPRLSKKNKIAAVEIHKHLLIEGYREEFNYQVVSKNIITRNKFNLLSFDNRLALSILSNQLNDYGYNLNNVVLRTAYDAYLISKKIDKKQFLLNYNKLEIYLSSYLQICNFIFGNMSSFKFDKSKKAYSDLFISSLSKRNNSFYKFKYHLKLTIFNFLRRIKIIYKSLFNKQDRRWLYYRFLIKIGLK